MKKLVTVRDVYEAMEKNGLEQIRQTYVNVDDNGNIVAGCLLTQAAFNLHTLPASADALSDSSEVAVHEDDENMSELEALDGLYEILNDFHVPPDSKWLIPKNSGFVDPYGIGSTIIYWYDREMAPDKWFLNTYPECLAMAHDLLAPIFDKEIEIEVSDTWKFWHW